MSSYVILYKKSVEKDLRKLSATVRRCIVSKILPLANDPRPHGVKKLQGSNNIYRLRHTDYRVVYEIRDHELVIMIIAIGHRREVYR